MRLTAAFAFVLAPLGALASLGGSVFQLLAAFPRAERRVSAAVAAGLCLLAMAGLAVVLFHLSPLDSTLTTWQFD